MSEETKEPRLKKIRLPGSTQPEAGAAAKPAMEETRPVEKAPAEQQLGDTEFLRMRIEYAARLKELEDDKKRIEEMGGELASHSEELSKKDDELGERERSMKKRETELAKKEDLIATSSDALSILGEDLREKERKVKAAAEESRKLKRELESIRAEITVTEERQKRDAKEMDEQRKNVERLLAEIQRKEEHLGQSEDEHSRRQDELRKLRSEADEMDVRLKTWNEKLKKKDEDLKALEQHYMSIEDDLQFCPHCGAVDDFARLSRRVEELAGKGENAEELNTELKAARRAIRDGRYKESEAHARKATELILKKELERTHREAASKVIAAESMMRMLRDAKADVASIEGKVADAWNMFRSDNIPKALELAEKAHTDCLSLEQDRFRAMDELVASNAIIAAMKRTGANVAEGEKRRSEAESAMAAGDFKRAAILASEAAALAGDSSQSQEMAGAMSHISLAEETLEELKALGQKVSEWEKHLARCRDSINKSDFKGAEDTAKWVRQRAKEAARGYKQSLMAIDQASSLISAYKDLGIVLKRAEELEEEAKTKLKAGENDAAATLARKCENVARETAERQKGANAALRNANKAIRLDRDAGKDVSRSWKLYDLALHQMELGEYANAMKLATKAAEACSSSTQTAMELCPACGEPLPEGMSRCPQCTEKERKKSARTQTGEKKDEVVRKTKLGAKGGRKYACPYCGDLFDIISPERPLTVTCPWCGYDVSVVD